MATLFCRKKLISTNKEVKMALFKKGRRAKYRPEFNGDYFFDYKDPVTLTRFISEGGKITPARISKLSLNQQTKLAKAIKKSRNLNLLPVGGFAYDSFGFPELVSPQPFSID
jgi:small subunit ribosomal protein S18